MVTEAVRPAAAAAASLLSTGNHPGGSSPSMNAATSETNGSGERPAEQPVDNNSNNNTLVAAAMAPAMINATTETTKITTKTTTNDDESVPHKIDGAQLQQEGKERTNETMKPPPPPSLQRPTEKESFDPSQRTDPNHYHSERSTTMATTATTAATTATTASTTTDTTTTTTTPNESTTSFDTPSYEAKVQAKSDKDTSSGNAVTAVMKEPDQLHSQSRAATTNPNEPSPHQQQTGHTKPKATTTTTTVYRKSSSAKSKQKHKIINNKNKNNNNKHKYTRLFRDALTIEVPLTAPTVDLGVLLPLARRHRIQALYRAFPACRPPTAGQKKRTNAETSKSKIPTETNDHLDRDTADLTAQQKPDPKQNNKKKKSNKRSHVPQPQEFDNVLDYLEAKYVQGVMVDESDQDGSGAGGVDGDGDDDDNNDDDDEMAGSVYSESSFINDTDLQRTIAEQVLAHATTTKLELQDDNEFFVNVGNLEVEESEMNHPDYDPLQDTNARSTKTTSSSKSMLTKKRKAKTEHGSAASTGTELKTATKGKKEKLAAAKKKDSAVSIKDTLDKTTKSKVALSSSSPAKKRKLKDESDGVKKKKKLAAPESLVKTTGSPPSSSTKRKKPKKTDAEAQRNKKAETEQLAQNGGDDSEEDDDDNSANRSAGMTVDPNCSHEQLQQISLQRKAVLEEVYQQLVSMIQAAPPEVLPRKKTKERVSLTCPMDKKPGDSILFSNPHVPGQRLKVKIPKNTEPGGTFRVTVPVTDLNAKKEETGGAAGDEETDYNKLGRVFHDTVDDYARAYDEWCDAEGIYRKAIGDTEYAPHFEKRKKFDKLVKEFPKDLKTPVDLNYLKKVLRRARQNRSKRELTLARHASSQRNHVGSVASSHRAGAGGPSSTAASVGRKETSLTTIPSMVMTKKLTSNKGKAITTSSSFYQVIVPTLTKEFLSKNYNPSDFSFL